MNIRTTAPISLASIATAALLLAGCGSSSKTATATAPAPTAKSVPTATSVGRGTLPVAGSTGIPRAKRAPTMATGNHDHAGELCSGRDQARYAGEGLSCVTGRLTPMK